MLMLRLFAVWTTTLGLSTWQVMTSTSLSIRSLVACSSALGSDQLPVKITRQVMSGLTLWAPSVKALILRSTWGIGLAATKPITFDLVVCPATVPERYWHSSI